MYNANLDLWITQVRLHPEIRHQNQIPGLGSIPKSDTEIKFRNRMPKSDIPAPRQYGDCSFVHLISAYASTPLSAYAIQPIAVCAYAFPTQCPVLASRVVL
eukprot:3195940-Rhodomonas_salina.3